MSQFALMVIETEEVVDTPSAEIEAEAVASDPKLTPEDEIKQLKAQLRESEHIRKQQEILLKEQVLAYAPVQVCELMLDIGTTVSSEASCKRLAERLREGWVVAHEQVVVTRVYGVGLSSDCIRRFVRLEKRSK